MSLWFFLLPKQWVKPGYGGDVKSIVGNRFSVLCPFAKRSVLLLNVRRLALARVVRVSGLVGTAQSSDERVVSDDL